MGKLCVKLLSYFDLLFSINQVQFEPEVLEGPGHRLGYILFLMIEERLLRHQVVFVSKLSRGAVVLFQNDEHFTNGINTM